MNPTLSALSLAALLASPLHAADVFYKKSLSLFVIHDVDQGSNESRQLDTAVGKYVADDGAVVYLKGKTLYQIRDTRNPKLEIIDNTVADFDFQDGVIAYTVDSCLCVRRLAEDVREPSRRVEGSVGASMIDIADGTVVFLKNQGTLYRVTDCSTGTSERIIYPVGEAQVAGKQ